jgi:hypothetical protein
MRFNSKWSFCALAGLAVGASAAPDFAVAQTLAAADSPSGAAFFDLEGDGDLDLAITVDNPDRTLVYTNTGGVFTLAQTVNMGAGVSAGDIAAGDWDRDGDIDLAVALQNNAQVQLLTNINGVLTFGAATTVGENSRRLIASDFDGDGDLDLACANRDTNNVSVLTNTAGAFTNTFVATGDEPRGLAAGDLNGDGRAELVVSWRGTRTIQVINNSGTGAFAPGASYSVGANVRGDGLAIADFTGDGINDVAVATSGNVLNFLALFTNTNLGLTGPVNFAPGGVNADGDIDVLVANQDSGTVAALENTGGAFAAPVTYATGAGPNTIALGDIDADGMTDFAVPATDASTVTVFGNAGAPPLNCPADFTGSSDPLDPGYGVPNGTVDAADFFYFLDQFAAGNLAAADLTGASDANDPSYGVPDGVLDASDFFYFLDRFAEGCL